MASLEEITDLAYHYSDTGHYGEPLPSGTKLVYYRGIYRGKVAFSRCYLSVEFIDDVFVSVPDFLKGQLLEWCRENWKE